MAFQAPLSPVTNALSTPKRQVSSKYVSPTSSRSLSVRSPASAVTTFTDAETEGLGDGDDANDVASKNIKKKKVASSTEEIAHFKKYALECIHSQAYKVRTGLGGGGKNGNDGDAETEGLGDGDDANDVASKNIKKKKLYPTIETNLKNINVEKFDLAFEMNPVFEMMLTAFDEGSARGWSLDRLRCYDGSQLLVLDPLTVVNVVEDVLPDSQSCRQPVSDVTVSSLLNACRDLILQITPRHQLPLLPLPQKVIHFLCDGDQITHSR